MVVVAAVAAGLAVEAAAAVTTRIAATVAVVTGGDRPARCLLCLLLMPCTCYMSH